MIWRNAVPVPWPRSVLPTKNVAGVVRPNHDPGIELPVIDDRDTDPRLALRRRARRAPVDAEADDEEAGRS